MHELKELPSNYGVRNILHKWNIIYVYLSRICIINFTCISIMYIYLILWFDMINNNMRV